MKCKDYDFKDHGKYYNIVRNDFELLCKLFCTNTTILATCNYFEIFSFLHTLYSEIQFVSEDEMCNMNSTMLDPLFNETCRYKTHITVYS